jgi:transposase-like protein
MAKRKRRAFTKEFKVQTVRLVRDSDKSIGALAGSWISGRRSSARGSSRPRWMRVGDDLGR